MSFDSLFDGSDAHMLSILDTVEPTGWYRDNCGDIGSLVLYADRWDGIANDKDFIAFYSRKTVESLLASLTKEHKQRTEECRKQALLEAEDVCAEIAEKCAYDPAQDAVIRCCDELRRMAEGKE